MKEKFNVKLRAKMVIFIVLLISIPLTALGIFSYKMTAKAMQSTIESQLEETGTKAAKSINEKIDSVSKYIEVLSFNEDIAKAALRSDKKIELEAFEYISNLQKSNSGEVENITIVDVNSKSVVSSSGKDLNTDFSDSEYVEKALTGSSIKSDVILSKYTGKPVVIIAYPLKYQGKITGVIIGSINFKNISKYASEINIGKKGHAYMINKEGVLIYYPDDKKVLKENISSIGNKDNAEFKSIIRKMKIGKSGKGYCNIDGKKFVVFTPVNQWSLAVTADYKEYMSPATKIERTTIILVLTFIIIALIIAYKIGSESIIKPIEYLEKMMFKAGEGDLTVKAKVNTGDEIEDLGQSFNNMIEHQYNMVTYIIKSSEEMVKSSDEMAGSSEEINASTEEITKNIEEVSCNAENQNKSIVKMSEVLVQLSDLVKYAQDKALLTQKNSDETMSSAKEGRTMVKKTVEAINSINDSSSETFDVLMSVDELSKEVAGIIDTINSISEQTNLLALNAAIEAARAGEHGRGFSVVADEVRKLSEESNIGATNISKLINEMLVQISKAVESMNSNKEIIQSGVSVINETDTKFIEIINSVEQSTNDIHRIVDITKDEVLSCQQVVELIDSVSKVAEITLESSQSVTASAEEQAASTETLAAIAEETSSMATSLNNIVEKFKI